MPSQVKIVDLPGGQGKGDDSGDGGAAKSSRSSSSSSRSRSTAANRKQQATDSELKTRLHTLFDKIADAAEARGDMEMAEVLRDERDVMATGIISLTRPFMPLRSVVVLALTVAEPFMAFGRMGRLIIGRVIDRRAEQAAEKAQGDTPGH